jgi:hypothetical protein
MRIETASVGRRRMPDEDLGFGPALLMPLHLVQAAVVDAPDPIGDPNRVRAVASRLHVSSRAAIEHLSNLTLMDENQRDELLRELGLAVYR